MDIVGIVTLSKVLIAVGLKIAQGIKVNRIAINGEEIDLDKLDVTQMAAKLEEHGTSIAEVDAVLNEMRTR